jgi:hypothetical protein
MKILRYQQFLEAISGTTDMSPLGPGFPRPNISNTISKSETNVIYDDISEEIYTEDQYETMYIDYLKNGGNPLFGFNKENLQTVLKNKL